VFLLRFSSSVAVPCASYRSPVLVAARFPLCSGFSCPRAREVFGLPVKARPWAPCRSDLLQPPAILFSSRRRLFSSVCWRESLGATLFASDSAGRASLFDFSVQVGRRQVFFLDICCRCSFWSCFQLPNESLPAGRGPIVMNRSGRGREFFFLLLRHPRFPHPPCWFKLNIPVKNRS
jgi:hypothetical protein